MTVAPTTSFHACDIPLTGGLVEASAGTGKTYALTTLFVRLVVERGLSVGDILVVTFTEAATAELRGRIRSRLRDALAAFSSGQSDDADLALLTARLDRKAARKRLARALQHVDEAAIHTIHAFCRSMLHDCAFESGARFDAQLVTDLTGLRDDVVFDYWSACLSDADPALVRALRSANVSIDGCRRLADLTTRPLVIVPESPPAARPLDAAAFVAAFERCRDTFARDDIAELLAQAPGLSRQKYRADHVRRWLAEAARYLAEPPERLKPPPDKLVHLTASVVAANTRGAPPPEHPFFAAAESLSEAALAFTTAAADHVLAFKRGLVDHVASALPQVKERTGVMAFDDLLTGLAAALARQPRLAASIRARFPVALVDEFQDTDPVQYDIFRRIYASGDLFVIGDPKQAIYAFRGADVFAYMQAARDAAARYTMAVNWRSDPSVLRALDAVFSRASLPFVMESIGFTRVSPRPEARDALTIAGEPASGVEVLFAPRSGNQSVISHKQRQRLPQAVAAQISRLLDSDTRIDGRPLVPGDVAVLTRTNLQAFDMQQALAALDVRSVVLGDQSVFDERQLDALELGQVLAAVLEPTRNSALRAALTTTLIGLTASELLALDAAPDGYTGWVESFRDLQELWSRRGFVQMFRALLSKARIEERLLSRPDGERRVTNLLHLMELLHTAERSEHLGPAGLVHWLATQRRTRSHPEAAQIRLESDDDAVRITTVHRSKGLEYPVVYCPYLWDGRLFPDREATIFHDPDDDNLAKLDLAAGPTNLARAEWEAMAESTRLAYVALTRARHRTSVVWGAFRTNAGYDSSALGYFLFPPPDVSGEPSVDAIKGHLRSQGDNRMRSELRALEEATAGALVVRHLDLDDAGDPLPRREPGDEPLRHRPIERRIAGWRRMTSFSQLTDGRQGDGAEGRDHDEAARQPPSPLLLDPLTLEEALRASTVALDPQRPPRDDSWATRSIGLVDFPRGPKAGNFFHEVLEIIDFTEPESWPTVVHDKLAAFGYAQESNSAVCDHLQAVMQTPLTEPGKRGRLRLGDVPRKARLDELEFYLPVASASSRVVPRGTQMSLLAGSAGFPMGRLTANKLAAIFLDHPSPEVSRDYHERIAGLAFTPLEGFLKGYVDLIFTRKGRWYLVDYKTNHLGDTLADYASDRLPRAMSHGHYYLQYHLYTVALHRLLAQRLPSYDYDRAFGGVFYLFLKGMMPDVGPRAGVFFEKPPRARIEALADLLERPPRAGRER